MRVVLVIIDGAGDEYSPILNGTPLQYASKKFRFLNKITEEGISGILHPVSPGVPPSSDIGHLSIFGYDIEKEYPGRGFFEAMGAGIKPRKGEVAFRVNLATVKNKGDSLIVVDRRAGRISGSDASELYKFLDMEFRERGIPARVIHTLEHRGVLLIKGEDLIGAITDTDPHELNSPVLAAEPWKEIDDTLRKQAEKTAEILNEITRISFEVLDKHQINEKRTKKGLPPANIILARGGGIAKTIIPFEEKWGLKPAFIAAGALYKGIARALGMHEITVEGATGTPNTNLEGKVSGCIKALDMGYDFVYLHIKAADNLSHDKKPREKVEFLIRIDRALEPLYELEDVLIVVTSDHSTSSIRGRHIGLPTPIVFWSRTIRRDNVKRFDEVSCACGGLGTIYGKNVMPIVMDIIDKSIEIGTRPFGKPLKL